MTWAKLVYQWLIWLFILGLGIQFFLAGLGALGGESFEAHEGFAGVLGMAGVILLVLAFLGKLGGRVIGMSAALIVLTALQYVWAIHDLDPAWLRSFHVFDAFLMAGLSQNLATIMGFPLRSRS